MALHNFIRNSALRDEDFDMCDQDENYILNIGQQSSSQGGGSNALGDEDGDMNVFHDNIINALFSMRG